MHRGVKHLGFPFRTRGQMTSSEGRFDSREAHGRVPWHRCTGSPAPPAPPVPRPGAKGPRLSELRPLSLGPACAVSTSSGTVARSGFCCFREGRVSMSLIILRAGRPHPRLAAARRAPATARVGREARSPTGSGGSYGPARGPLTRVVRNPASRHSPASPLAQTRFPCRTRTES